MIEFNLEEGKNKLLLVVVVFCVAAIIGNFLLLPEISSYKKSSALRYSLDIIALNANIEEEISIASDDLKQLELALNGDIANTPENQLQALILGELQAVSQANNIKLIDVKPTSGETVNEFSEVLFVVKMSGNYFDVYGWLNELDEKLGFIVVQEYQIRSLDYKNSSESVIVDLKLATYRRQI